MPELGHILALSAAMIWSCAVILFKQSDSVSAAAMNLFKNVGALVLLLLTFAVTGDGFELNRPPQEWAALAASGVIGIAIGDTLEFEALRRLGAGRLAVVNLAYAPIIVSLSVAFLDESLNPAFLVGAALVIGGVGITVKRDRGAPSTEGASHAIGVAVGVGAMVCMGISVVLVKPILETDGLVEITIIRLAAGLIAQTITLGLRPKWRSTFAVFKPSPVWRTLVPAAFLGCYLAMLLWLGGFKYADASTASVLNQMSTIFTIVLARLILKERFSRRQAFGAAFAFAGAITIVF